MPIRMQFIVCWLSGDCATSRAIRCACANAVAVVADQGAPEGAADATLSRGAGTSWSFSTGFALATVAILRMAPRGRARRSRAGMRTEEHSVLVALFRELVRDRAADQVT